MTAHRHHNKPPSRLELEVIENTNGRAKIYKRGDGRSDNWYVMIWIPSKQDNVHRSTRTKDKTAAKKFAMDQYIEFKFMEKHGNPISTKTFIQVAEEYFKDAGDFSLRKKNMALQQTQNNTLKNQRAIYTRFFIEFFGNKPIHTITGNTVKAYWKWRIAYWDNHKDDPHYKKLRGNGIPTARTLKPEATLLGNIFKKAIELKLIRHEDKPDHIIKLKTEKVSYGAFTKTEMSNLIAFMRKPEWFDGDSRPHTKFARRRLLHAVTITAATGMRPPEVYNLRWGDFNPENRESAGQWVVLHVRGKAKSRQLTALWSVYNLLKQWKIMVKSVGRDTSDDSYVFAGYKGEQCASLNPILKATMKLAQIPYRDRKGQARSFYSLRHTYATSQIEDGVDVYKLADNMDTSIKNIENSYGQISDEAKAKDLIREEDRIVEVRTFTEVMDMIPDDQKTKQTRKASRTD